MNKNLAVKNFHSVDGAVFDIAMNLPQVNSQQTLVPFVSTIKKSNNFTVIEFSKNNNNSEELLADSSINVNISNSCYKCNQKLLKLQKN